jgi:hypothetical protein
MEPTNGSAPPNVAAAYEATMVRRGLVQQRVEGEEALRLIQAAALAPQGPQLAQTLPLNATFSVRV